MSCAATKEKAASSGMSARMVMKARAAARCGMPSSADRSSTRRRKVCASPSRRLQAALASPSGSSRARTRRSRLITARITRRREARARLLLPRPGELSAGECDGREKDARRGGGESQRGRGGAPRAADRGGARRGAALPARGRGDEARGRARLAGRQAEGGGRGAPAPPGVRPGQQDGRHRRRGSGRPRARQPGQVAGHRGRRRVPRRPALPPLGRRLAEGPPLFLLLWRSPTSPTGCSTSCCPSPSTGGTWSASTRTRRSPRPPWRASGWAAPAARCWFRPSAPTSRASWERPCPSSSATEAPRGLTLRHLLHISDVHFGPPHLPELAEKIQEFAARRRPDVIALSGDLTQRAKAEQFRQARKFVDRLPAPTLVVPGNHDVPLYRVWERALSPFHAYRKYFAEDLEPVWQDDELLLVGINTAHGWTVKEGRIGLSRLKAFAETIAK